MTQKLNDYLTALVRTCVPLVVGLIVAFAFQHGLDLHAYTPLLTVIVAGVFYAVVHYLEHFVHPAFGWLLGIAKNPTYAPYIAGVKAVAATPAGHTIEVHLKADVNGAAKSIADALCALERKTGIKAK